MNPMQIIQLMRNGGNPQQLAMSLLQNNSRNPMMANLLTLAQNNDAKSIEQIARNLAKQRGIDFDKELAQFKSALGLR